jgi:phytoene/squalene synthetase
MARDALDQPNRHALAFERYADAVSGVPARLLWDLLAVPGDRKQAPVRRRARSHATTLGRYCYHAHLARDLAADAAADRIKIPLDFVHHHGGVATPAGIAAVRRAWLVRPAGELAPAIFNLARLHRGATRVVLTVLAPYQATIQSGG